MPQRKLPTVLIVVAILFIIAGVSSAIDMLATLFRGGVKIDFGILNLFVGIGLLKLSRGWRTCGLAFLWIGLIGIPLVAVLFLLSAHRLTLNLFGVPIGYASPLVGIVFAAAIFALFLWQYRVLTRPYIRQLFGL